MTTRYGMIHGRFQPFHRGHFAYASAALDRCDHLIVGITNPDPSTIVVEPADPDRHRPVANPFTFFERQLMIRAAFDRAGIEPGRFSVVPFPIHHPDRWPHYVPPGTLQLVRVFSEWGLAKTERFRTAGYPLEVLHPGAAKEVSGQAVREAIRAGRRWEDLVPAGVDEVLVQIDAADRLRQLDLGGA